ncbi:MAG TPA: nuclear transport factor 2 family protein [Polyangiaceae bacterium]|nr:nuclear transport factor 2 family protein [Polyangiaceae bacterium]
MSKTNIELVQEGYADFTQGNVTAILANMTSDVTIGIVGRKEDAPFLGIRQGKEGAAEFFQALHDAHEIHLFEPQRYVAAEDKVFVWGHYRWTMRKSGVSKDTEWMHVWTIRDGKCSSFRGHNDTAMLVSAYHGQPVAKLMATG